MEILFTFMFFHQILGAMNIDSKSSLRRNKGLVYVLKVEYPRMGHEEVLEVI
jgi:hypothetical protein